MPSRFKRQQKVRRWNESLPRVPPSYLEEISKLQGSHVWDAELDALLEYLHCHSVFTRIDILKRVVEPLLSRQEADDKDILPLLSLLCRLLLVEHVRQLHRQLLSGFRMLEARFFERLEGIIVPLLKEAAKPQPAQSVDAMDSRNLVTTIGSLLEYKPGQLWLRSSCTDLLHCLCRYIRQALQTCPVLPSDMDGAQEAISCAYLLLQRFGCYIMETGGKEGCRVIAEAGKTMLWILQGDVLVREGMASVAVTFWSAACSPAINSRREAHMLADGLLSQDHSPTPQGELQCDRGTDAEEQQGPVEVALLEEGNCIVGELRKLSTFGHIGALRGLLSKLPMSTLLEPLAIDGPEPLTGCLLTFSLQSVCHLLNSSIDAHLRYHALHTLTVILERLLGGLQTAIMGYHNAHNPAASAQDDCEGILFFDDDQVQSGIPAEDSGTEPKGPAISEAPNVAATKPGVAHTDMCVSSLSAWDCDIVLGVLWKHLEDSLSQTERQVHSAFKAMLDVLSLQQKLPGDEGLAARARSKEVIDAIMSHLLTTDSSKKGKYAPLAALIPCIGARKLLDTAPNLLQDVILAFDKDVVCRAAASFLKPFLGTLLEEINHDIGAGGIATWRQVWRGPILAALCSSSDNLRMRIGTYVLPLILELDELSIVDLVDWILETSNSPSEDEIENPCGANIWASLSGNKQLSSSRLAGLFVVLKVGRQMHMIPSLDDIVDNLNCPLSIPYEVLLAATRLNSENLAVSMLELVCLHPRLSDLPAHVDLDLYLHLLRTHARCVSSSLHNKWMAHTAKLMTRLRTAVKATLLGTDANKCGRDKNRSKSVSAVAVLIMESTRAQINNCSSSETHFDSEGVARQEAFMQQLTRILLSSMYPGAPYARKNFAMGILSIVLEAWAHESWVQTPVLRAQGNMHCLDREKVPKRCFSPFCPGLIGSGTVKALLGAAVDPYDQVRSGAVDCLMHFPTPLPGMETPALVEPLVRWACTLVDSPRLRDSDAGARLLLLVQHKYIHELGWIVQVYPATQVSVPFSNEQLSERDIDNATMVFWESLCGQFEANIAAGELDLLAQCHQGLAHGVLLTLQYMVGDMKWHRLCNTEAKAQRMKQTMSKLIQNLGRAANLCTPVLSATQEMNTDAEDVRTFDEDMAFDEYDDDASCHDMDLGPSAQLLTSGCWLTMKEVSLLMGSLSRHVPLPDSGCADCLFLLSTADLEFFGDCLVSSLMQMKHNGAIEKTAAGFEALCERLLRCGDPPKRGLPEKWMHMLLDRIKEQGQERSDTIRRSAGLPVAFSALFRGEPQAVPKVLLPKGFTLLLSIANGDHNDPWRKIHSLNCLRHAFNDKSLSVDASAFVASGVQTCIEALFDMRWGVRNAASLCFTALHSRMLGCKNSIASAKPLTIIEFFGRYPSLLQFLHDQLSTAVSQLRSNTSSITPSLLPVLLLFAKLQPSASHWRQKVTYQRLSDILKMCQWCAKAPHLGLRELAARAVVSLVGQEAVDGVLDALFSELPKAPPIRDCNMVHGTLLQIREILSAYSASSTVAIDHVAVLKHARECMWLTSLRAEPGVLRREFVRILSTLFDARPLQPPDAESEDWQGLTLLAIQHLDKAVLSSRSLGCTNLSPMHALWLKECAKLLFRLEASNGIAIPNALSIERIMASSVYECRAAGLKSVTGTWNRGLRTLGTGKSYQNQNCSILHQSRVSQLQALKHECNPKVLHRLLELLSLLGVDSRSLGDQESLHEEWKSLWAVLEGSRHVNVRRLAFVCLAHSLGGILKSASSDNTAVLVKHFVEQLDAFSSPWCPVDFRRAAVDAIKNSRLLGVTSSWCGDCGHLLDIWEMVLTLLEDEDEGIRRNCASMVSEVLKSEVDANESAAILLPASTSQELHGQTLQSSGRVGWCDGSVGLHEDHVERAVISHVADSLRLQPELHLMLLNQVANFPANDQAGKLELSVAHRLYNRESDNQHEDVLLRSQAAAAQFLIKHISFPPITEHSIGLPSCTSSPPASDLSQGFSSWRSRLFRWMELMLQYVSAAGSQHSWVGGPTNQPRLFVPMYRGMLALGVLGEVAVGEAGDAEASKLLTRFVDALDDVGLHPILGNLLACMLGDDWAQRDRVRAWLGDSYDPDFKPMWLCDV
eukprot:evm.model.scf_1034.1 EVM.evm.TU.scf_1034.1   scf_1034:15678-35493(-)